MNPRGFTFVEMLVASALAGIVFVGLASVQGNFSLQQMSGYRKVLIENQASHAANLMRKELAQASHLVAPPPNGPFTNYLLGGVNVTPVDPGDPGGATREIVDYNPAPPPAGEDRRYFYFCVSGTAPNAQLVYFRGPGWPPPTILYNPGPPAVNSCPASIDPPHQRLVVAGVPLGTVQYIGNNFNRFHDNIVKAYFVLGLTAQQKQRFRQNIEVEMDTTMMVGLPTKLSPPPNLSQLQQAFSMVPTGFWQVDPDGPGEEADTPNVTASMNYVDANFGPPASVRNALEAQITCVVSGLGCPQSCPPLDCSTSEDIDDDGERQIVRDLIIQTFGVQP